MTASLFVEELHGIVDGRVEPDRRADVLRRLAGSPADRALVEAWQSQTDLIREAFSEVATEAMPVALDLSPPRLRSVDSDRLQKGGTPSKTARHGSGAAITAALLITIGLTLSWMAGSRDDGAAARASATADADKPAGPPSFKVSDLSASGLRLIDVSSKPDAPTTIVLRYREGAARVALEVARNAPDIGPMPLERAGKTLTWRSQGAAFTLAGTLSPERLRAIAVAMQADQGSD